MGKGTSHNWEKQTLVRPLRMVKKQVIKVCCCTWLEKFCGFTEFIYYIENNESSNTIPNYQTITEHRYKN